MQILCVIPSYYPAHKFGGSVSFVHGLNKALVKKGIEVTVYTTNVGLENQVPFNKLVEVDRVKVFYFAYSKFLEFFGTTGWQFSLPMRMALKRNLKKFDMVHMVSIWNYPTICAAHYCRKYRKPYIISPIGHLYPYTSRKKFLKKWLYYNLFAKKVLIRADAIHFTSEDEARKCQSYLGLKNRIAIVYNGIDMTEFLSLPKKSEIRNRYPILHNKEVILFLGRITPKKGLDILLKAYTYLLRKRDNLHLLLVGNDEGGYCKRVKEWANRYGIENRITFTGILKGKEKLEAYTGSDIFVLPSYSENFGMTVIEAIACGTPVVISDQVGICKEIERAQAGIVVENKVDKLAKAIETMLNDQARRKKMIENGKTLIKENFEINTIADKMIGLYSEILKDAK